MSETPKVVVNEADAPEIDRKFGDRWGAAFKILTPSMRPRGGKLGVNRMRLPPGRATVPFHTHLREDEVFYILSGQGVLRYGDELHPLRAGDCVSCPAGTGVAHQIANNSDEELVYLSIGAHEPHEVCTYPDSGKVLIRGLQKVGRLEVTQYFDGEGDEPKIFALAREADAS